MSERPLQEDVTVRDPPADDAPADDAPADDAPADDAPADDAPADDAPADDAPADDAPADDAPADDVPVRPESHSDDRYRLARELGRGGMGAVWLAWDDVRQQEVAIKRAFDPRPEALLRFKREFRVVEQLRHPHLVRVYELGEDSDGVFFTMEVIDGKDLYRWCRDDPKMATGTTSSSTVLEQTTAATEPEPTNSVLDSTDIAPTMGERPPGPFRAPGLVSPEQTRRIVRRLSRVVPQLLDALSFLHGHNIVHCDLKPSNVLVTRSGQLKLLDFGVLAEIGSRRSEARDALAGTLGYIPPEQLAGEKPSVASDLYALGVMLYQVVAGRPPFVAKRLIDLLQKQANERPVPLAEIVCGVPAWLSDAVELLLAKDPNDRPSLPDATATLLPDRGAVEVSVSRPAARPRRLLGRDEERATLRCAALEHLVDPRGSGVLVVQGPTGSGKTLLVDEVLADLEAMGHLILRGRARSAERVAFNALDAAIDDLAAWLEQAPDGNRGQLHRHRIAAAAIFPVLRPKRARIEAGSDIARGQAFDGLIQLLRGVTDLVDGPPGVVLFSDDVQWADQDCVALMQQLVETRPGKVLLMATLRDDVGASTAGRWLGGLEGVTVLDLAPLDDRTIETIIREASPIPPTKSGLNRAIAACDGRPMLAELAGRLLGHDSLRPEADGMSLQPLFETLPDHARSVLCLIAAADTWVSRQELLAVSGENPGQIDDLIDRFLRDGLVRRDGPPGDDRVDIYHDSIRAALLETLSAAEWTVAHRTHARHQLEINGPAERLVRHLLEAGEAQAAALHARRAAAEAERQCAFGLAAAMYAVALKHPGKDRLLLLEKNARALEHGARYEEAARAWRTVAEATEDEEDRNDAYLGEAFALLACDRVVAGHEKLHAALRRSGSTSAWSRLAGLAAGIRFLLGPPGHSSRARAVAPNTQRRAQRDVRIGMIMGYSDPLAGVRFLRRAQSRFAASGLNAEVAWCDLLFAYFVLNGSARPGNVPLCERYLAHGRQLLASVGSPDGMVSVFSRFIDAVKLQRNGLLAEADQALGRVLAELEALGAYGSFEHLYAASHRSTTRIQRQRPRAVVENLEAMRGAIRDTADSALRSHFAIGQMLARLMQGDIESAREIAAETQRAFPPSLPTQQGMFFGLFAFWPEMYLTDCRGLHVRMYALIHRSRRFRPYSQWSTGAMCGLAALLEANALRAGDPNARPARIAKQARRADRCVPIFPGMSWRARAYATDAAGRAEEALMHLERAEAAAKQLEQPIDVAIARYQRGRRIGGDEGAALIAAARQALVALGASVRLLEEDVGMRR